MDSPLKFINNLPKEAQSSILHLRDYKSPEEEFSIGNTPLKYRDYPQPRVAAVLVLLYHRAGRLRVLLTTRSKKLRSHPGQVALPGGKSEPEDGTPERTARREAFEETLLPLESPHIHTLCYLPPYVSLWKLIVTPVVAYLSDISVLDSLQAQEMEVDHIFDHPLERLLDPTLLQGESLSVKGSEDWPYQTEFHDTSDLEWIEGSKYRMHRMRTSLTPIKGMTSDILIMTAEIAFQRSTAFSKSAEGQVTNNQLIEYVMRELKAGPVKPGRADGKVEPYNPYLPVCQQAMPQAVPSAGFYAMGSREAESIIPSSPAVGDRGQEVSVPS